MTLIAAIRLLKDIFKLKASGSLIFHFDGEGNIKPELRAFPDMIKELAM